MRSIFLAALLALVCLAGCDSPGVKGPPPPAPAKKQLVYVGSKACAYCLKMQVNTLGNAKVKEEISANYVFIDASGKDGAKRYSVTVYPTYILMNSDGTEIKRGVGYRGPEEFLAWLNQAPK
jgi:thioredoxin-related protein